MEKTKVNNDYHFTLYTKCMNNQDFDFFIIIILKSEFSLSLGFHLPADKLMENVNYYDSTTR